MGSLRNPADHQNGGQSPQPKRLCYFYVVIPPEDQVISKDVSKAVTSAVELAAIMKRNPRARFQAGSSEEEARARAISKIQFTQDAESIASLSPKLEGKRRGRASLSAVESSLGAPATESPKIHDLLMMGREILTKRNDAVFQRIENNPRLLCTDTESPTILQEGCKYNALHLAAKCNNSEVVVHILNLVSSLDFMKGIYPTVGPDIRSSSTKHLLNAYLNTPDKMASETPLHIACKFNHVECAEVLLLHPWCDTEAKNYDRLTPFQVIGSRADRKGSKSEEIRCLFKKRFIVPIWRDEDVIGDPPAIGDVAFVPDLGQLIPPALLAKFPDFSTSLLNVCNPKLIPRRTQQQQADSTKVFLSKHPSWEIKAFAGPVEKGNAKDLRNLLVRSKTLVFLPSLSPDASHNNGPTKGRVCVTPPTGSPMSNCPGSSPAAPGRTPRACRQLLFPSSPPFSPGRRLVLDPAIGALSPMNTNMSVRVTDAEKGLERIASDYCHEMKIPWSEYWPFLGKFCNLRNEEGLNLLEGHLRSLESAGRKNCIPGDKDVNSIPHKAGNSGVDNSMDELINKLTEINLDGCGMSSPGTRGECRNPKCGQNWCYCDNVVPNIPLDEEYLADNMWICGDSSGESHTDAHQPFMRIRKLGSLGNTDSFEETTASSATSGFNWTSPEGKLIFAEVFETAPSSPVENDIFEDCWNKPIFLCGDKPGKLDLQVFQILRELDEEIDKSKHLAIFQWLSSMRAHGDNFGKSRRGNLGGYTPKRLWEPGFISTPVKQEPNFDDSF